jgi:hypothetical protein
MDPLWLGNCCFFLGWIRYGKVAPLLAVVVVRVHAQLVPLRRARRWSRRSPQQLPMDAGSRG